uniref:Drebrin-like protein (Trinotate prediction) n=1 Tax=Myxobolus squamalis TaxID=59785 RepID=A0A6B2G114_MYXSQ
MSLNLKKYGIDLIDKWNKFIEINEDNSWILYGFEGQTFTLIHWGSGNNGIEELSEELSDSSMMYGAVCLRDPSSLSHKIIFIIWQGQSVPGYIRHKVKTFDEDIKKFFKGYNCDITARSYSDLSNGLVEHKPISENKSEIKVESREMNSNKNIESCQEKQTSKDIHIQTQPV